MLRSERCQRIQPLAVFCEPHGDYRHAVHRRVHRREILHRAHERLIVVEPRAADDLAVHNNTAGREFFHDIDAFTGIFIVQQLDSQLGIGRVDGNVHRAYVQIDYALYLALGEISKRDVISQQEAQSRIVVFKVHCLAHTLGELVDKAEHTVIRAASRIVHEILGKLQAEITSLRLLHTHDMLRTVGSAQRYVQHGVIGEILIVEHIVDHISVYADYLITYMRLMQQRTVVIYF